MTLSLVSHSLPQGQEGLSRAKPELIISQDRVGMQAQGTPYSFLTLP